MHRPGGWPKEGKDERDAAMDGLGSIEDSEALAEVLSLSLFGFTAIEFAQGFPGNNLQCRLRK